MSNHYPLLYETLAQYIDRTIIGIKPKEFKFSEINFDIRFFEPSYVHTIHKGTNK